MFNIDLDGNFPLDTLTVREIVGNWIAETEIALSQALLFQLGCFILFLLVLTLSFSRSLCAALFGHIFVCFGHYYFAYSFWPSKALPYRWKKNLSHGFGAQATAPFVLAQLLSIFINSPCLLIKILQCASVTLGVRSLKKSLTPIKNIPTNEKFLTKPFPCYCQYLF